MKKSNSLKRRFWKCDRKERERVYNYANEFLSPVHCASLDDEIHEQSRVCEQHIIVHKKHAHDQYMNVL